jgi:hypothetical protein
MFKDQLKCVWASPYYIIDIPLKKDFKLTVRIPDEYQEMIKEGKCNVEHANAYGVEGDKPYIKVFDEKNGLDVTEVFLKKVDRTKDITPSTKNLWTIIDVVHCAIQISEDKGGDR